jgi:hypothetical protein
MTVRKRTVGKISGRGLNEYISEILDKGFQHTDCPFLVLDFKNYP